MHADVSIRWWVSLAGWLNELCKVTNSGVDYDDILYHSESISPTNDTSAKRFKFLVQRITNCVGEMPTVGNGKVL